MGPDDQCRIYKEYLITPILSRSIQFLELTPVRTKLKKKTTGTFYEKYMKIKIFQIILIIYNKNKYNFFIE